MWFCCMSFLFYMGKYTVGPKVFKREPRSTAGEGGGAEWAAETGEAESADTWGPAQCCHTFTASSGGGTVWVALLLFCFRVCSLLLTSVFQLQERVSDLEGERNLLKNSYDSLLEWWVFQMVGRGVDGGTTRDILMDSGTGDSLMLVVT